MNWIRTLFIRYWWPRARLRVLEVQLIRLSHLDCVDPDLISLASFDRLGKRLIIYDKKINLYDYFSLCYLLTGQPGHFIRTSV